jgi:hypothetical protein
VRKHDNKAIKAIKRTFVVKVQHRNEDETQQNRHVKDSRFSVHLLSFRFKDNLEMMRKILLTNCKGLNRPIELQKQDHSF